MGEIRGIWCGKRNRPPRRSATVDVVAVAGSLPLLRWESPGRGSPGHGRLTAEVTVVEGSRLRSFVHRSLRPVVEHGELPFWEGAGVELEGGLPALSVGLGI